jgi:membrane protease YdiL (CAAX protease family)
MTGDFGIVTVAARRMETTDTAKKRALSRVAIQVGLFLTAYFFLDLFLCYPLFRWVGGEFAGPTTAVLVSAVFASWLALRAFEDLPLAALGLWWNRASVDNLATGLGGGIGSACLVMVPPLVLGVAHVRFTGPFSWSGMAFTAVFLVVGAAGEELLCRGYAFQVLMSRLGPVATVLSMGALFGLLHRWNPNATWFGVANTAGFGILFGYAYVRSRDLWLPIGLHFGWNVTLPLFGANLSGIKIINEVTGHRMVWTAGDLWSGGEYGPEASVLTTGVLLVVFVFLWKAPIRRQDSPLTDPPKETVCDPSRPLPPPP